MFQLYLRGEDCENIRKLTSFSLGQVVACKVLGTWERRRAEYDLTLRLEGVDAIKRSQMETALLAADMLTASAILNRDRIRKFLLTKNERDLGDLSITSIRGLRETLEILMTATRQTREAGAGTAPAEEPPPPRSVVVEAVPVGGLSELAAAKRAARLAPR